MTPFSIASIVSRSLTNVFSSALTQRSFVTRFCAFGLLSAIAAFNSGCSKAAESEEASVETTVAEVKSAAEILKERDELDKTIWVDEVEAQKYETVFVRFWDSIRAGDGAGKLEAIADFPLVGELTIGKPGLAEQLELGVTLTKFKNDSQRTFSAADWADYVKSFEAAGIRIIQTEWHHSRFVPKTDTEAPKSSISFSIHAFREETLTTFGFKGELEIEWIEGNVSKPPVAEFITVTSLKLQERSGGGYFKPAFEARHGPDDWISAYPVIAYDLDGDQLSEIIIPRWNRVYWNRGDWDFEVGALLDQPIDIWEAGIFSDFNGDGHADFVTVGKDGKPYFYEGTALGRFPDAPTVCADIFFDMPTAITAGDTDGDGDLDLWMTQYKLSFTGGQMPTPYYDANDGHPSFYLENDGSGSFTDITEEAGLGVLRDRRTYSASFVDLDEDGDLDLMNVSDYAGLDVYENDGAGQFTLATDDYVDERYFFGMGHTIGDYNSDGMIDLYVIGMSSTTARRLDRLNLGREDRPDIHSMRSPMGYGNRLYFGNAEKKFHEEPDVIPAVARTGWSWGTTTFDFDLDGDQDIYVANGHRSGESCQDYCTTFWRHDIYTGDSEESPLLLEVFSSTLSELNNDQISWNGFEKNVLFVNQPDRQERFTNSGFMFGAAFEYDSRSVISDDFDADGRPDLIVTKSSWNGRGFESIIRSIANDVEEGLSNNWLAIHLRESAGPGFSPNGAKVSLKDSSGRLQTKWIVSGDSFLAQHATVAHFGLGDSSPASVEVTWPNGDAVSYDIGDAINTSVTIKGTEIVQ